MKINCLERTTILPSRGFKEGLLSLFFVLLTPVSTLESFCFVRTVGCGNDILSTVNVRLTTPKRFTCIQWSSPIALCAKHRNRYLEKGIYRGVNCKTIGDTSKGWESRPGEMRRRDGKEDNIWRVERLESQKASSGIWYASLWQLLSYPIFFFPSISVCFSIWRTRPHPSPNTIPGSTTVISSGQWCLYLLASHDSTSHRARWGNGVVRR